MAAKSGADRAAREERNRHGAQGAHPAQAAASNLDRLIHERTRLAIVSALETSPAAVIFHHVLFNGNRNPDLLMGVCGPEKICFSSLVP